MRILQSFLLVLSLGLFLTSCGVGGSGGDDSAPATEPRVDVPVVASINGTLFDMAKSADFSNTPILALVEKDHAYKVLYTSPIAYLFDTYSRVNGITKDGLTVPGWYDGRGHVYAVDSTGAIRQIGTGIRDKIIGRPIALGVVAVTLFDISFPNDPLPLYLPPSPLVDGQTFIPEPANGIVMTIHLNQTSRDGAAGCIKLTASVTGPDINGVRATAYYEKWLKPGLGALYREKYRLSTGPNGIPDSGEFFIPFNMIFVPNHG